MKHKYFIDSQKAVTALVVLAFMAIYKQWENPTAWTYLALHGSYGFLWVMKSQIFPDQSWEKQVSLAFGLLSWVALCLYWVAPWLLTMRNVQAPGWYLGMCVCLYSLGVFTHFTSDMQKWSYLRLRPGELISEGMYRRVRNINYFGELIIYTGFGLLAMHWIPIAVLMLWVVAYWIPRMRAKDRSLERYAEFQAYKSRSKLFIPYLF